MNNRQYPESNWARVFKPCKKPSRSPQAISQGGSMYWFGKDKRGMYMVRLSDHWGKVGNSYYLFSKQKTNLCEVGPVRVGKTYF
jgi:hypothetical protein